MPMGIGKVNGIGKVKHRHMCKAVAELFHYVSCGFLVLPPDGHLMLCHHCNPREIDVGVLLPEATLTPVSGGKRRACHTVQNASNCPAR